MSVVTWTVTDADEDLDRADWAVGPNEVPGTPDGWSVTACRRTGGLRDGVSVIRVDNGQVAFTLIPSRGMGIWRGEAGERTLGWESPVRGPVHPRFVPISEPGGLGWLSGFDELLVRCGLESNGAPEFDESGRLVHPLHGRIANLPAGRVTVTVDAEAGTIAVTGIVNETRFLFRNLQLTATFTTGFGESGFAIRDEVTNNAARPASFQMLYHINIGAPLLDAGSQLHLPVKQVVPRNSHAAGDLENWSNYGPPRAGFEEQVYFFEPLSDASGKATALLHNAAADEGVELQFSPAELPCFSQWKNTAALEDGYVTGIEPATNYPNPRGFEAGQGRVVELAPGDSRVLNLSLNWLRDADAVGASRQLIDALQSDVSPVLHESPHPDFCDGA